MKNTEDNILIRWFSYDDNIYLNIKPKNLNKNFYYYVYSPYASSSKKLLETSKSIYNNTWEEYIKEIGKNKPFKYTYTKATTMEECKKLHPTFFI